MRLHDTHFHLDLFQDTQKLLDQIEQSAIYTIAVTNLPVLFKHTSELLKDCIYMRAALGFHPELIASRSSQIALFKELLPQTRYIGEVGLDNLYKASSDYTEQKKVFEQIVYSCNDAGNKILTIHSRRAEKDVISMIGQSFNGKVILHWYSGSIKELEKAVDCGFFFSINYAMTQSLNGKKIISAIPDDRLLLETDGPYVKFGEQSQPFTPVMTSYILDRIREIKGWDYSGHSGEEILYRNFSSLLSI